MKVDQRRVPRVLKRCAAGAWRKKKGEPASNASALRSKEAAARDVRPSG